MRECLAGEKIVCLHHRARRGQRRGQFARARDGQGRPLPWQRQQKRITNGFDADGYSRRAPARPVRAHKGLSMLLLEKSMPGITVTKMDCMGVGQWHDGIEFDRRPGAQEERRGRVSARGSSRCPQLQPRAGGFSPRTARMARTCVEESLAFARSRRTFGEFLIEHQAIQRDPRDGAASARACRRGSKTVTFQMNTMSIEEQNRKLGRHIALSNASSSARAAAHRTAASANAPAWAGAGQRRAVVRGRAPRWAAHLPRRQGRSAARARHARAPARPRASSAACLYGQRALTAARRARAPRRPPPPPRPRRPPRAPRAPPAPWRARRPRARAPRRAPPRPPKRRKKIGLRLGAPPASSRAAASMRARGGFPRSSGAPRAHPPRFSFRRRLAGGVSRPPRAETMAAASRRGRGGRGGAPGRRRRPRGGDASRPRARGRARRRGARRARARRARGRRRCLGGCFGPARAAGRWPALGAAGRRGRRRGGRRGVRISRSEGGPLPDVDPGDVQHPRCT